MTALNRRRLFIGVVVAAAALVGGRGLSALYADYSWYAAHAASLLWNERAGDSLLIYGVGGVVAPFVGIKAIDMLLSLLGLA